MRLRCTNCPAELELGTEGRDTGDIAYKLLCLVLRDHFKNDVGVDCPCMRTVKDAAALRGKRRRESQKLKAGRGGSQCSHRPGLDLA